MGPGEPTPVELYLRYGPVVYRRCLELLNDREAAGRATTSVFVALVRKKASFRRELTLEKLRAVATMYCAAELRHLRRAKTGP